jgi:hypothetical protein
MLFDPERKYSFLYKYEVIHGIIQLSFISDEKNSELLVLFTIM